MKVRGQTCTRSMAYAKLNRTEVLVGANVGSTNVEKAHHILPAHSS
jgi:hypothetical protein